MSHTVPTYLLFTLSHSSLQKWPAVVNYIISILPCLFLREQSHFFKSSLPVHCRQLAGWHEASEITAEEVGTPQYRTAHIFCLCFVSIGPEMTLPRPNNHLWKDHCFDYCPKCAAIGQFAYDCIVQPVRGLAEWFAARGLGSVCPLTVFPVGLFFY